VRRLRLRQLRATIYPIGRYFVGQVRRPGTIHDDVAQDLWARVLGTRWIVSGRRKRRTLRVKGYRHTVPRHTPIKSELFGFSTLQLGCGSGLGSLALPNAL
jgi:hypothetical protein